MSFSTPIQTPTQNPTPTPTQTQTQTPTQTPTQNPTPTPTPAGKEEDNKPNDKSSAAAHINLKVKGQDQNELLFSIKRSTQLQKLMSAYCARQSMDQDAIVFLFNGRRLRAEQTPDELDMEDGDEIDAMLQQDGGGS